MCSREALKRRAQTKKQSEKGTFAVPRESDYVTESSRFVDGHTFWSFEGLDSSYTKGYHPKL